MKVNIPNCKEFKTRDEWNENPHSLHAVQKNIFKGVYATLAEHEPHKFPCLAILEVIWARGENRCDIASYTFIYNYEVLE